MCQCSCGAVGSFWAIFWHIVFNPGHIIVADCDGEGGVYHVVKKFLLARRGFEHRYPFLAPADPLKPSTNSWRQLAEDALAWFGGKPPYAVAYAGAAQRPSDEHSCLLSRSVPASDVGVWDATYTPATN
jgi:hypothetical protein